MGEVLKHDQTMGMYFGKENGWVNLWEWRERKESIMTLIQVFSMS